MSGFCKREVVVVSVGEGVEEEGEREEGLECAWCLAEQGRTPVDGSHGICLFHSQQMVAQAVVGWRRGGR